MPDQKWGDSREGLALSAQLSKAAIATGDPLRLDVAIKNVGRNTAPIVSQSEWLEYELFLTDANGTRLPLSQAAQQAKRGAEVGYTAVSEIKPGEVQSAKFDLEKAFDLSKAGSYSIHVEREVFQQGSLEKKTVLVSNTEKFQVK